MLSRDLLPPPALRHLPVVRRPWLRGGATLLRPAAQPLASRQVGAVPVHAVLLPPA